VQLHKVKELLNFEKNVIALILDENQDDAKSFMEEADKARIDSFAADLYKSIDSTAERLKWEVIAWVDNNGSNQKKFATDFVNGKHGKFDRMERGLLFKIKNDIDNARGYVHDLVRANLGTGTKLDAVRGLIDNIKWEDY